MMFLKKHFVVAMFFVAPALKAAPQWTLFDDDTGVRSDFPLDPDGLCPNEKKAQATEFGRKFHFVPEKVRDTLMPLLAITSDERQYTEVNSAFCKFSLMLADTGCDTKKIKIVTRIKSRKLGQVNEGPKGKKYITEFAVYGCNKLPEGRIASDCTFPRKEGEDLYQPMENSAFGAFISRCHYAMYAIGGPYSADVELEDSTAPVNHITRDPKVAVR